MTNDSLRTQSTQCPRLDKLIWANLACLYRHGRQEGIGYGQA